MITEGWAACQESKTCVGFKAILKFINIKRLSQKRFWDSLFFIPKAISVNGILILQNQKVHFFRSDISNRCFDIRFSFKKRFKLFFVAEGLLFV